MKKSLFTALAFCIAFIGSGQVEIGKRLEFEIERSEIYDLQLFNLEENGFLLVNSERIQGSKDVEMKFDHYNTDLELQKSGSLQSMRFSRSFGIFISPERAFLFSIDKKGNFELSNIEIPSLKAETIEGMLDKKTSVTEMQVLGDFAFFKTRIKKEIFLMTINWKSGQKNIVRFNLKDKNIKRTYIERIQKIHNSEEILVFVDAYKNRKETDMYVVRLDEKGQIKETLNLTKKSNYSLSDLSASAIDDDILIYTGTYSEHNTASSIGIFFCKSMNGEAKQFNYYKFTELDNFFSYLPEKKQEKIEKKQKKKKAKGKELQLSYNIAGHEIKEVPDGYLFLGEAYYPTYRTTTRTYTTYVNGQPQTRTETRTEFDGYQYTHAVLTKFSKDGELLWDQTFPLRPMYKPFSVTKFISFSGNTDESVKMVYHSYNKIYSKKVGYDGKVIEDVETEEIESIVEGDDVKGSDANIKYWYDNYFLSYGYQRIKNKTNDDVKRKRFIFYVQKVKF
jgi:hypothetical protein